MKEGRHKLLDMCDKMYIKVSGQANPKKEKVVVCVWVACGGVALRPISGPFRFLSDIFPLLCLPTAMS